MQQVYTQLASRYITAEVLYPLYGTMHIPQGRHFPAEKSLPGATAVLWCGRGGRQGCVCLWGMALTAVSCCSCPYVDWRAPGTVNYKTAPAYIFPSRQVSCMYVRTAKRKRSKLKAGKILLRPTRSYLPFGSTIVLRHTLWCIMVPSLLRSTTVLSSWNGTLRECYVED